MADEIRKRFKFFYYKSLNSTQDKAKEFSKKGLSNIVIVADAQAEGRGRLKRKWHSGKGGLWMSVLLKPKRTENLQLLTFAAAIAVVKSVRKTAKLNTSIKWPNDVNYKGKKLCGILTEGIFGKENYVIVGIGINVNQSKFYSEVKHTAISLRMIKHEVFNIKTLMKNITENFFHLYDNYYEKNKFNEILEIWKKFSDTIGKNVSVAANSKTFDGKAVGIGKDCSLLLKLKNGKTIKILEGDVGPSFSFFCTRI